MSRLDQLKEEEGIPTAEQGCTTGKVLDGIECPIRLGSGTSKCFISKNYCLSWRSLHPLPKHA